MKTLSTQQIRQAFLDYFKKHKHTEVPSGPLVPPNDPSLLFTNAGMVQFKDVFLGAEQRSYTRATSTQRCVRAGGKHNDLEQVGHTKRHHTFFEMLGNFSFGDYFKREAIQFAWDFLTKELKLPTEKLWVTVYKKDKESEKIWLKEMKIDPQRFSRCGEKDNFWSMGDIGPCGPCTEIFYDHGPEIAGGPPGSRDQEGDRYVEIWNLVFMQFERNVQGEMAPLPKPCVDTGMGLERVSAVMQGVHDNYEIDLFQNLLAALGDITGCLDKQDTSMRVIVDHIRSAAFLIADGVVPANEGRGYVLRRIIRRAVRHGYKLGQQKPFFYRLTPALVKEMGKAYPALKQAEHNIKQLLKQEEEQFASTLENGLKVFDQVTEELSGNQIPGATVFQLYDTYGFPVDLTADLARERGLSLDYIGFEVAMGHQRQQSQKAHSFKTKETQGLHITGETAFSGYETLSGEGTVTTLLREGKPVSVLETGQKGAVVLDSTPFYAESGGQVGDHGYLYFASGNFRVSDTQKHGNSYLHFGELLKGKLHLKERVHAEVDETRHDIVLNHSATHLLHEALRRVLGEHVMQKGSLVEAKRLRFDFAHPHPVTKEQLLAVEHLVNQQIRANTSTQVQVSTLDEAKQQGAVALFGEKYAEKVRVVSMGDFSNEVCGGTHVEQTGDIGLFKITSESACAAGIRRIEALAGHYALAWVETLEREFANVSSLLKVKQAQTVDKLSQVLTDKRKLEKELSQLKQRLANQQGGDLATQAVEVRGINVLAKELQDMDSESLRQSLDKLKQQLQPAAIVLATVKDAKVQLVAGVSKDCLNHFKAGDLLNHVAQQIGGRGGGRPDFAQGGGEDVAGLGQALASVSPWIKQKVG